jgi:hypothetical protein
MVFSVAAGNTTRAWGQGRALVSPAVVSADAYLNGLVPRRYDTSTSQAFWALL